MLLGLEVEFRRRADLAQFLVGGLVADRNVGRQARWEWRRAESRNALSSSRSFASPRWMVTLSCADLVHQRLGARPRPWPPWPGRSPSRRRCGGLAPPAISEIVAAALLVQLQNSSQGFAGLREAAIGQPLDKGVLILANPFDVEQGLGPTGSESRLSYKARQPPCHRAREVRNRGTPGSRRPREVSASRPTALCGIRHSANPSGGLDVLGARRGAVLYPRGVQAMEQIVIACKKIREAARLLAAANERTLAEKRKPLRSRWTARMSNNPWRTCGEPRNVGASSFFDLVCIPTLLLSATRADTRAL